MTALRLAVVCTFAAAAVAASAFAAFAQEMVVVPTRVIYPGETLSTADIQSVALRRSKAGLPPIAFDRDEVEGRVARSTLLPGRLIALSSLRDAYAVEPGKPVQVQFIQGTLTISVVGVPLQAGSAGDMIRVRNIDSGVVFSGTVMADGTVRVGAT
jgi:flagella basal body P-ring formation protein FlgA